jgi:phosphate transport system substrate-binding protein
MLPTRELVATEDYPLSRRLFFYLKPDESNQLARALVNFVQSQQGQEIVARTGFIAQTVQATQVQTTSEMPQAYRTLAEQAQRLTVNLRFKEGSASLDNKAHYDIARITDYLKSNDKLYRKVVLVGFGDPKPDPERASLLSKLRAVVVSQALRSEGLIPRDVVGFGDKLPVAANIADEGRQKNQRVEVWVY